MDPPDDQEVSLVINDTKPTDNFGNPISVNGYQSVALADGIAIVWHAATLKTVNGATDGIQDVYARIIDPVTGQFVTDEINVTDAQQTNIMQTLRPLLEEALQ